MTDSRLYAIHLEKKLIEDFKEKFKEKLGYSPIILTKVDMTPMMSLAALADYFEPYLPEQHGRKLTLTCKSRKREVVELRMIFCYMARMMRYTLGTIGEFLNRDHTTIIHNVSTFLNLMETDDGFKSRYNEILNHINQSHESPVMDQFDPTQRKSQPSVLPGLLQA